MYLFHLSFKDDTKICRHKQANKQILISVFLHLPEIDVGMKQISRAQLQVFQPPSGLRSLLSYSYN